MKQVNTFSGRSFAIDDEQVESIKQLIMSGEKAIVELNDGSLLNVAAIESVGAVETEPYYGGNKMNKSRTRVFIDGEWKMFAGKQSDIEERPILIGGSKRLLN